MSGVIALPAALDHVRGRIAAVNRAHPAFMASQLSDVYDDLHAEVIRPLDGFVAALAPRLDTGRSWRIATVSLRISPALLPLTLDP